MQSSLNILMAEDNPADAELVLRELDRSGFDYHWKRVDNEPDFLGNLNPDLDLILSDYDMPQFNGFRALELLRQSGMEIPFILVSGTIGEDTAVEAMKLGAADYLLKDRLSRLTVAIRQALEKDRLRRERKNAVAALRDSEQRFRVAVEAMNGVVYDYDAVNDLVRYSPTLSDVIGYAPEDIPSTPGWWKERMHPADNDRVRRQRTDATTALDPHLNTEYRIRHRDGREVWIWDHSRASYDSAGRLVRVVGCAVDITERKRAEEELIWRTAFFEAQVDSALDGIIVVDNESRKILQNQRMNDLWKIPREIAEDQDDNRQFQFVMQRAKDPKQFAAKAAHLYAHPDEISRDEIELVDGTILDRYSAPVRDGKGRHYGRIWTFRDITEHRRAEAALRESEARLSATFEGAGIGIALVDADGHAVRCNPALSKMLGYSPYELAKMSFAEFTHPQDVDPDLKRFRTLMSGESDRYDIEKRFIRRDGRVVWGRLTVSLVHQSGKAAPLAVAMVEDITSRKLAVEALRESRGMLEKAQRVGQIGSWVSEVGSPKVDWSDETCRIFGFLPGEFDGRLETFFSMIPAEDREIVKVSAAAAVNGGRPYDLEHRIIRRDGQLRWVHEQADVERDAQGRPVRMIGVVREITERKVLEEQFRQSQKMEAVGQLAGGVAHDFNNLLTIIQGNASLLGMSASEGGETRDLANQIAAAAERAAGLTRQLLLFSRKQVMQPVDIDLNRIVGNMTKMLQRILGEDIVLLAEYAPNLPLIHADAGMIEQVLMNLAVNSRDAMPGGGRLTITTGLRAVSSEQAQQNPETAAGRFVSLSVSDTGSGIPAEVLPHIFEPFFTTKEAGKGTGLGLATAYGIIKQHHGWIEVASDAARGTLFHICLPAIEGGNVEQPAPKTPAKLPRGTETILLVEDEAPLRTLATNLLQRCGYSVVPASSGKAALEMWDSQKDSVQLLLTDLIMPDGVNGRELGARLQSKKPSLKIVYTSGYSAELAGQGAPLVEGVNFLQKPYDLRKLAQTIRNSLDNSL